MKTIYLRRGTYNEQEVYIATFSFSKRIFSIFHQSHLGQWSSIHRGWILPASKVTIENLNRLFKDIAFIDTYKLYNPNPPKSEKKSPVLPPLHSTHEGPVEKFKQYMKQHRYSENTIKSYADCLAFFFRFHSDKSIDELGVEDLIEFNKGYVLKYNYSASFQNQTINAIKLFYHFFNGKNMNIKNIERPISEKKLPVVLSLSEVERLLNSIPNLKHKSMIMLIYSCGLRRSELLNMRVADIDSDRMIIHIKGAKGKKDRVVPLSDTMLKQLRSYAKAYRPKDLLFTGQDGGMYAPSSLQNILRTAVRKVKIKKHVTLHTLRHSYATHLLESGVNLRYIQEVLGHNSPKTTQIYTHVSSENFKQIISPLEKLKVYDAKNVYNTTP